MPYLTLAGVAPTYVRNSPTALEAASGPGGYTHIVGVAAFLAREKVSVDSDRTHDEPVDGR